MKIVVREVRDLTVVDLNGKILIGEGDDLLRDTMLRLVEEEGKRRILLNMAEVPYVDAAGLCEMVRSYTTVSKKGGRLGFVSVTKKISDLLAITKLLTVFPVFATEEEALAKFREGEPAKASV